MTCPECEYHKNRAAIWRAEAYKHAGYDVIEHPPVVLERPWVGLTDEEFEQMLTDAKFTRSDLLMIGACVEDICNMVEAKLKEKNHE